MIFPFNSEHFLTNLAKLVKRLTDAFKASKRTLIRTAKRYEDECQRALNSILKKLQLLQDEASKATGLAAVKAWQESPTVLFDETDPTLPISYSDYYDIIEMLEIEGIKYPTFKKAYEAFDDSAENYLTLNEDEDLKYDTKQRDDQLRLWNSGEALVIAKIVSHLDQKTPAVTGAGREFSMKLTMIEKIA